MSPIIDYSSNGDTDTHTSANMFPIKKQGKAQEDYRQMKIIYMTVISLVMVEILVK